MRRPKKKTFNEIVPLISEDLTVDGDILGAIFSTAPESLTDLMNEIFGDYASSPYMFISNSMRFRSLWGDAPFSSCVLKNPYFELVTDNGVLDTISKQRGFLGLYFQPYFYKWRKLLENVYSQEYNPISNYDRNESMTTEFSGSELVERGDTQNATNTETSSTTKQASNSRTNNTQNDVEESDSHVISEEGDETGSLSESVQATTETDSDKYGFNSVNSVPTDKIEGTSSSSSSNTTSTHNEKETTDTITKDVSTSNVETETASSSESEGVTNNQTQRVVKDGTEEKSFNNRRDIVTGRVYGNIGVTTSQQMLESEIELRIAHDFFNEVFEDIKNELIEKILN